MLEDIDFYCVDNIRALLKAFISHTIRGMGAPSQNRGRSGRSARDRPDEIEIPALVGELQRRSGWYEVLYLHASDEVLLSAMPKRAQASLGRGRHKYTRRVGAQAIGARHRCGLGDHVRREILRELIRERIDRGRRGGSRSCSNRSATSTASRATRISSSMCAACGYFPTGSALRHLNGRDAR